MQMLLSFMNMLGDIGDFGEPQSNLAAGLFQVLIWIFAVVAALIAPFAIWLGFRLASARDSNQRREAKKHVVNAVVSMVIILVLIGAMMLIPVPDGEVNTHGWRIGPGMSFTAVNTNTPERTRLILANRQSHAIHDAEFEFVHNDLGATLDIIYVDGRRHTYLVVNSTTAGSVTVRATVPGVRTSVTETIQIVDPNNINAGDMLPTIHATTRNWVFPVRLRHSTNTGRWLCPTATGTDNARVVNGSVASYSLMMRDANNWGQPQNVYSVYYGVITFVGTSNPFYPYTAIAGRTVIVQIAGGALPWFVAYSRLSSYGPNMEVGRYVNRGQLIGQNPTSGVAQLGSVALVMGNQQNTTSAGNERLNNRVSTGNLRSLSAGAIPGGATWWDRQGGNINNPSAPLPNAPGISETIRRILERQRASRASADVPNDDDVNSPVFVNYNDDVNSPVFVNYNSNGTDNSHTIHTVIMSTPIRKEVMHEAIALGDDDVE